MHRLAAACEGLDDDHAATAAGTATRRHVWLVGRCGFGRFGHFRATRHREQLPRPRDIDGAIAIGEQSIVADAVEAAWQHVDQETSDELVCCELHQLVSVGTLGPIILPLECDASCVSCDQPAIGDWLAFHSRRPIYSKAQVVRR